MKSMNKPNNKRKIILLFLRRYSWTHRDSCLFKNQWYIKYYSIGRRTKKILRDTGIML